MDHQKVAVLMLQPGCNMTCEYCVIEENFSGFSFEEATRLLEKLKIEGYTNVILGGGEPTIWKGDVFQLARVAKSHGFFVQIGTNAIRLPTDFAKNTAIDRWILPLDSSHEEIHNQLRHYRDSHYKIMIKALKNLSEENRPLLLSTVITSINKDSLSAMVDFLNEYNEPKKNLESWNLYRLLPIGRGGYKNIENLQIAKDEFETIVQLLMAKDRNFKITVRKNMYSSQRVDFFHFQDGKATLMPKLA